MAEVRNTIVINRPVEEVFSYATNIENQVQWVGPITEARQTSDGPVGIGTTAIRVMNVLGRTIETPYKYTEFKPNSSFSTETTSGSLQTSERFTFESVEGGTKVVLEGQVEASGVLKIAGPVLAGMARRQSAADMGTMKDLLESQS